MTTITELLLAQVAQLGNDATVAELDQLIADLTAHRDRLAGEAATVAESPACERDRFNLLGDEPTGLELFLYGPVGGQDWKAATR